MAEEVHIGKLIKHQVNQRPDLTIRSFAERLGVHEQTVYDIYRRADIHTDQLKRIAEILDLPITYFFFPDDLTEVERPVRPADPAPVADPEPGPEPARNGRSRDAEAARPRSQPPTEVNGSSSWAELRRELAWAEEKIALLEARLRDKEELIALLRASR